MSPKASAKLPNDSFQECSFIINQAAWSREYVIILKNIQEIQLLKTEHTLDRRGSIEKGFVNSLIQFA